MVHIYCVAPPALILSVKSIICCTFFQDSLNMDILLYIWKWIDTYCRNDIWSLVDQWIRLWANDLKVISSCHNITVLPLLGPLARPLAPQLSELYVTLNKSISQISKIFKMSKTLKGSIWYTSVWMAFLVEP